LPIVAESGIAPQFNTTRALLGFGSSAITEREQIERDPLEFDPDQVNFSRYFKDLFLKPIFDKAEQKLNDMDFIAPNWDSYGAPPPGREARNCAREILILLQRQSLPPSAIVPSSEGGVAICFLESGAYADIECLNTGEILAVTYKGNDEPYVWDVGLEEAAIRNAIERIRAHFAA